LTAELVFKIFSTLNRIEPQFSIDAYTIDAVPATNQKAESLDIRIFKVAVTYINSYFGQSLSLGVYITKKLRNTDYPLLNPPRRINTQYSGLI